MTTLRADLAIISNWIGGEARDSGVVADRQAESDGVIQQAMLKKDR